jgi:hypothetical protein
MSRCTCWARPTTRPDTTRPDELGTQNAPSRWSTTGSPPRGHNQTFLALEPPATKPTTGCSPRRPRIVGRACFTTRPSRRSRLRNITLNRPGNTVRPVHAVAPARGCECWTGTSQQPSQSSATPHHSSERDVGSGGLGVVAGCHGGLTSTVIRSRASKPSRGWPWRPGSVQVMRRTSGPQAGPSPGSQLGGQWQVLVAALTWRRERLPPTGHNGQDCNRSKLRFSLVQGARDAAAHRDG